MSIVAVFVWSGATTRVRQELVVRRIWYAVHSVREQQPPERLNTMILYSDVTHPSVPQPTGQTIDLPIPAGYAPKRMGLIASRGHRNVRSAALSLARNRASKIAKLVDAGREDLAAKHLADLRADVADFLQAHAKLPADYVAELKRAACPIALQGPAACYERGDVVSFNGGMIATVAHTYLQDGRRWYALEVARTADPPHPRHGARWSEQYHADQELLSRLQSPAASYPYHCDRHTTPSQATS